MLWDVAVDPSVLPVAARPASRGDRDTFDLKVYSDIATAVVTPDGRECVSLSDGYRRIRIDVEQGTLLCGPVHLSSVLIGLAGIDAKILTLRRLVALRHLGRFARGLHPSERLAPRWIMAVRACDAMRDDASQREFATVLFGGKGIGADWREASNFRRLRVQRLMRIGRSMTQGGYRALLR